MLWWQYHWYFYPICVLTQWVYHVMRSCVCLVMIVFQPLSSKSLSLRKKFSKLASVLFFCCHVVVFHKIVPITASSNSRTSLGLVGVVIVYSATFTFCLWSDSRSFPRFWLLNGWLRSSRSQMFFKKGVLKNFANITEKHLCWSLFLIKLQSWDLQLY